jgi:hypothetical protein
VAGVIRSSFRRENDYPLSFAKHLYWKRFLRRNPLDPSRDRLVDGAPVFNENLDRLASGTREVWQGTD